ncbi:hypothetical protein B0H10DRAFT_1781023, partial [Mycena sp. CBHHK59/15]
IRWQTTNPSLEGKCHIISMVIGGRTQYLTRVQGMPRDIEETLEKTIRSFLWDGKTARVALETMILPVDQGGKGILDISSRNKAIDLWNLQCYLMQGEDSPAFLYFVDYILRKYLETSYLNVRPGQIINVFLNDIHFPIPRSNTIPDDLKCMISVAQEFNLKFTALSIDREVQLGLPMWKHPSVHYPAYKNACLRDAATCLRNQHKVQTVRDALIIATRRTTVPRRPHTINPSGIGRKNCGCPPCNRDRNELGYCIMPKWNPLAPTANLCNDLKLTAEELDANQREVEIHKPMTYDLNFRLPSTKNGFRIFAGDDSMNEIAAR